MAAGRQRTLPESKKAPPESLAGLRESKKAFAESLTGLRESKKSFPESLAGLRESKKSFPESLAGLRESKKAFPESLAGLRESKKAFPESLASYREGKKAFPGSHCLPEIRKAGSLPLKPVHCLLTAARTFAQSATTSQRIHNKRSLMPASTAMQLVALHTAQ